jgi:hypothetical protein
VVHAEAIMAYGILLGAANLLAIGHTLIPIFPFFVLRER